MMAPGTLAADSAGRSGAGACERRAGLQRGFSYHSPLRFRLGSCRRRTDADIRDETGETHYSLRLLQFLLPWLGCCSGL